MPRGRRRKIEVPTDTQPQFELGDTAEEMRERRLNRRRGTERGWRERREDSQEKGEKRTRTNTDTAVESTRSRQKKGQMKSIFLSDSDEDAIVGVH